MSRSFSNASLPVAEVPHPVGERLQLVRLHLGAVLRPLEVAHLRHDAVDGPVEAGDLRVQAVDEAPQQRLALVGELRAFDGDAVNDGADGLAEGVDGVVLVPDDAAVDLAALRRCAEQRHALADCCGGGSGRGVDDIVHDDLLSVHPPRRNAPS